MSTTPSAHESATDPATTADRRTRTARRGVWIALGVVIAWFLVGGIVGPMSGKLSSAQKNDNAAFLPASAESTKVIEEQKKFSDTSTFPTIVLFTNDSGITPQQLKDIGAWAEQVPAQPLPGGSTIGDYLAPGPVAVVPSQDGQAVLANVLLDGDKVAQPMEDGKSPLLRISEALRESSQQVPGVQAYVTGPGGILGDLVAVFGEIDTKLLGTTALVVAVILILVYRSPFIWLIPLFAAGIALSLASALVYLLATNDIVTLNGQSQGILTVLVFGAGTDYALLLVSRYREELHHHESHVDAMLAAWRGVVEPIVASAATVTIGLLCLLFSELNSNKSTGPVAAVGIAAALVVMLTFLPALLVVPSAVMAALLFGVLFAVLALVKVPAGAAAGIALVLTVVLWVLGVRARRSADPPRWAFFARWPAGRWAFWPKVPRDDDVDEKLSGVWSRVAGGIGRRPRPVWVLTTVALLVLAAFTLTLQASGITTTQAFTSRTDSVVGQEELAQHFPGGLGSPTIIIANEAALPQVLSVVQSTPGVATVYPLGPNGAAPQPGQQVPPKVVDGRVQIAATLSDPADSQAAEDTVVALRSALADVPDAGALVGGTSAVNLDTQQASIHDRNLIIPIVLVVILLILMLLLRAILAPVLLVGTVVLSFFATLGACALFFNHVFDFPGADSSFPLFAFVFLVALGIDYNIFLMTRVREESVRLGTRPGILKGLTVTGGVITSAGVVLAATFLVLGVLPLVFLREVGFAVAFGVLLDTLIVRSLLVPALSYDIGRPIWWPSALWRRGEPERPEPEPLSEQVSA